MPARLGHRPQRPRLTSGTKPTAMMADFRRSDRTGRLRCRSRENATELGRLGPAPRVFATDSGLGCTPIQGVSRVAAARSMGVPPETEPVSDVAEGRRCWSSKRDGGRPERSQPPLWRSSGTKPTAVVAVVRNEANRRCGGCPERSQPPLWRSSGTKPTAIVAVVRNEANRRCGWRPERSQPPLWRSSGTKPTAVMAVVRNEANCLCGRRPERSQLPLWRSSGTKPTVVVAGESSRPRDRDALGRDRGWGRVPMSADAWRSLGSESDGPRDFGGRAVELRGSRANQSDPGLVAKIPRSTRGQGRAGRQGRLGGSCAIPSSITNRGSILRIRNTAKVCVNCGI